MRIDGCYRIRHTLTLTVSQSSRNDLEKIGFKNVKVIPMGIGTEPVNEIGQKENNPTVIFIGRLKRHKLARPCHQGVPNY